MKSESGALGQALRPLTDLADKARSEIRSVRAFFHDIKEVYLGYQEFKKTGTTPNLGYHHMKELYCKTRGLSNDLLHRLVTAGKPLCRFPDANGILGNLTAAQVKEYAAAIRRDGYYVFPTKLSSTAIDSLVHLANTAPCRPEPILPGGPDMVDHVPEPMVAGAYRFQEPTLVANPEMQKLISDHSLMSVAQEYLGSAPILDLICLWWSHSVEKGKPAEGAAQLYHFDMDRIKWLKFFVHLTDVDTDTGPHMFVKGSHRSLTQPRALLKYGYARLKDEEVSEYFPKDQQLEFVGPKGTIIAVDTRGLHKGKPFNHGKRLMVQLEFCNSLFGAFLTRTTLRPTPGTALDEAVKTYRDTVYSKFMVEKP